MLQGKIVIVTGGAKGIGRYAAHTLAQAGGNVVIVDVDVERLHKTLGELRDLKFEAWALAAGRAPRGRGAPDGSPSRRSLRSNRRAGQRRWYRSPL